ncbi:MAG: HU family DNA-binding protein [Syntrophomonadaceae bacterium]|nr:HU family DNA-binding protein [Syntrophomonadaceae bacterium]
MNKAELISDVAARSSMTKKDVEKVVSALFSSIEESLKRQEKVQLVGFGTFEVRDRKPRTGRNPQTGEEIKIPASRVPAFKAGKNLRNAVV